MFTKQRRKKKLQNFFLWGYMLISLPFLLQCHFQLSITTAHTTAINFMPLLAAGPFGSCMNSCLMCFQVTIKAHSLLSFLMDLLLPLSFFFLLFFFFLVMMWDLNKVGPWNSPFKSKPRIHNPIHYNYVSRNPKEFFAEI